MKRVPITVALLLAYLALCLPLGVRAAWDKGFNFRQTSGYVTDGANETYVLDTDSYPTTRNSVTFGWTVSPGGSRDRNSGLDRRLAGINFGNGSGTFQIDLPASGTYTIHLALGDSGSEQTGMTFTIKDNSTTVLSYGPLSTAAGNRWFDATPTEYTQVTWPTSETPVTQAFSSTTFVFVLGAAVSNSAISHLFLSQESAGSSSAPTLPLLGAGPGA